MVSVLIFKIVLILVVLVSSISCFRKKDEEPNNKTIKKETDLKDSQEDNMIESVELLDQTECLSIDHSINESDKKETIKAQEKIQENEQDKESRLNTITFMAWFYERLSSKHTEFRINNNGWIYADFILHGDNTLFVTEDVFYHYFKQSRQNIINIIKTLIKLKACHIYCYVMNDSNNGQDIPQPKLLWLLMDLALEKKALPTTLLPAPVIYRTDVYAAQFPPVINLQRLQEAMTFKSRNKNGRDPEDKEMA